MIDSARRFIGMYGLRPLGAAVTSEDDEEHEHRVAARSARRALDATKLARRPAAGEVRSRTRPKTATPRTSPAASRTHTSVNVQELGERVSVLMEKLSSVDAEIASLDGVGGLPTRARLSDLERQRTTTLTTLAALEKARRNHTR